MPRMSSPFETASGLLRARARRPLAAIRVAALCIVSFAGAMPAHADVTVEITGRPIVVFDSARDGCTPDDIPDVNARAFHDASGQVVMFALHDVNRALRGPDVAHLKIDCHVALDSPFDADPAHYADRNFIAATWTTDGRTVSALVHEEYHADDFKRCHAEGELACWYNSVLSYRSSNGGADFSRTKPLVVAAAPFRQDVEQGRHRGFFNPSNIVTSGGYVYALISTTGWTGQAYGNCLFRTADPSKAGSWRAFDGKAFSIRYDDPYGSSATQPKPCATIGPFPFAVGSIVKHRASGTWIATMQASAGGALPLDGFYYATSRDLIHWGPARILLAHKTLYGDLCKAGPSIVGYPSMIDPQSPSRNFDEVGDHPDLMFASMAVASCQTGQRLLVREQLTIRLGDRS
jgi:hypothetical protein